MKIPVACVDLVGRKDGKDSPAFELFERRETVVECFENSLFTRLVALHALDLLLVKATARSTGDGGAMHSGALTGTGATHHDRQLLTLVTTVSDVT